MGTRGTRGWCGGFGIVPEFRGTGASKLLANEMVRVARDTGLTQLQLEVLSQNSRALKLYERVDFFTHHRLCGLEIATSALVASGSSSLSTERVPPETLLPLLQQDSDRPCWDRELASVLVMDNDVLGASGPDGQLNAFIVQRFGDKIRLQTALLQSELTDDEFAALLHAAAADATIIQIFNEPERSSLFHRYLDLGFSEFFSQYEMFLNL